MLFKGNSSSNLKFICSELIQHTYPTFLKYALTYISELKKLVQLEFAICQSLFWHQFEIITGEVEYMLSGAKNHLMLSGFNFCFAQEAQKYKSFIESCDIPKSWTLTA